jgi:hypothetical protein
MGKWEKVGRLVSIDDKQRKEEEENNVHILLTNRSLFTGFFPLPFGASVLFETGKRERGSSAA